MKYKIVQVAQSVNVSPAYISQLKNGLRYTTNPDLAVEISKLTGKAPIEHISPRVREAYKKAYPYLNSVPVYVREKRDAKN
jgi:hypothetical protein